MIGWVDLFNNRCLYSKLVCHDPVEYEFPTQHVNREL